MICHGRVFSAQLRLADDSRDSALCSILIAHKFCSIFMILRAREFSKESEEACYSFSCVFFGRSAGKLLPMSINLVGAHL